MVSGKPRYTRRQPTSLGGVLSRFFQWWGRELAALVPRRLLPRAPASSSYLWAGLTDGAMVFYRLQRGGMREVGRVDLTTLDEGGRKIAMDALLPKLGGKPIGVRVEPDKVLRKRVSLPYAVRENLAQVLAFEMDRQSPYKADQVYFHHRVVKEDMGAGLLEVDLTILPRPFVLESLAYLREWGVPPHVIAVNDELDGRADYANLLPAALRPPVRSPWPWIYAGMAATTLALTAVALLLPLWQKREVVIALQPQVEKVKRQADTVSALKGELEASLARHNFLLDRKLHREPSVAVLEEVSWLLPDDTWVQQFEMKGHELRLQGETASSAKLIGFFESSKLFEEASFAAPLVKVRARGQVTENIERFQLAARIRDVSLDEALHRQQLYREAREKSRHAPRKTGGSEARAAKAGAVPGASVPAGLGNVPAKREGSVMTAPGKQP